MDLSRVRSVSFEGGGMSGRRYVGTLKALRYHLGARHAAWFSNVAEVSGTSSGSIIALAFLLELSDGFLEDFVVKHSTRSSWLKYPDLGFHNYGLDSGQGIRSMVQDFLTEGGLSYKATMNDLFRFTRKTFRIATTDVVSGSAFYVTATNEPDMLITDAIYASCCIPGLFTPVDHGDKLLVDGGIVDNRPFTSPVDCLFLTLRHPSETLDGKPKNMFMYMGAIIHAIINTQPPLPVGSLNIWCVPRGTIEPTFNFDDQSASSCAKMIEESYVTALDVLTCGKCSRAIGILVSSIIASKETAPCCTSSRKTW